MPKKPPVDHDTTTPSSLSVQAHGWPQAIDDFSEFFCEYVGAINRDLSGSRGSPEELADVLTTVFGVLQPDVHAGAAGTTALPSPESEEREEALKAAAQALREATTLTLALMERREWPTPWSPSVME